MPRLLDSSVAAPGNGGAAGRRRLRHAAVAALVLLTTNAKDPRELTLELLSDRAGWSNLKMASRSGARYECSAGEARLASQVTQKTPPDKPATLATLLASFARQSTAITRPNLTSKTGGPKLALRAHFINAVATLANAPGTEAFGVTKKPLVIWAAVSAALGVALSFLFAQLLVRQRHGRRHAGRGVRRVSSVRQSLFGCSSFITFLSE